MNAMNRNARIAGAIYASMVITAPFSLIYVPNTLIVRGNATATAGNILAHEMMFRLGIVADLIGSVIFLFTALALYRLLSGVNKAHASMMVILALSSIPVSFLNTVNDIAALILVRGGEFLSVFSKPQRDALAMVFLRLHGNGLLVNEIFWGLWLLPFGLLVMRSGFLPRILGILLIVNGFAYPVITFTTLLAPSYAAVVERAALPAMLGELWIMLWLLIKGVNVQRVPAAPQRAVAV